MANLSGGVLRLITGLWSPEPGFPAVDEVRVWEISLDSPPLVESELRPLLTDEERARGDRYRAARAYHQFVTARGLLRILLGRRLGLPPSAVPLTTEGGGKPVLVGSPLVQFNVSHTDSLALIALAHRPVGVDVERLRVMENPEGLVKRYFSRVEQERYLSLPSELRPAGFFRGWTCKEALIKAAGLSVSCLDDFDVELDPERPPVLLGARHARLRDRRWGLGAWTPSAGHAAAVAVEGVDGIIRGQ